MKKSKFLKKSLAMLLALMLVVAMIPLSASAALPEGFDLSSIVLSETSNRNGGKIVDLGTGVNVKVSEKSDNICCSPMRCFPLVRSCALRAQLPL